MCLKDLVKPFEQLRKAPLILILLIVINLIISFAVSDYLIEASFDFSDATLEILGLGHPLAAVPSMLYTMYPDIVNMLILFGFIGFFSSVFTFALVATGVKSVKDNSPLLSELGLIIRRIPGLLSLTFLLFLLTLVVGFIFLILFQLFTMVPYMGMLTTVISIIFILLFLILIFMYAIKLFVAIPAYVMNVDLKPQKAIRASLEFSRGKYLHIFLLVLAVAVITTVIFNLLSFVLINLEDPLLSICLAVVDGFLAWYMFLVPSYYYSENK